MKAAFFVTGLILAGAFILGLSGCANPAPREADPAPLGSIGFEAARIAAEAGLLF